ncbi:MAG: radical SAM protein [Thermodesulfobacteriota bacterium]
MKRFRYLYGPVPSRRLGRSLGIDLVPHKICTYDCIYCQIGKTTRKTLFRKEYVPTKKVLEEVRSFLSKGSSSIDYLSLTGSGEPTLHSEIRSIIKGIKEITSIPVAVITNGSLFFEREVREDLLQADVVLPSLDAVSPEIFLKINRSHKRLSIGRIIEGMVEFRKIYKGQIWLEILFCKGVNDEPEELRQMKGVIKRIRPDRIHLNTVVRPPSEKRAVPLNQKEMEKIRAFFGKKASIISEFDRHLSPVPGGDLTEEILKILKRRPLSLADLSIRMAVAPDKVFRSLDLLVRKRRVRLRFFGDSIYYEAKEEVFRPLLSRVKIQE